jgi:lipoyl(octanoyl) transferase
MGRPQSMQEVAAARFLVPQFGQNIVERLVRSSRRLKHNTAPDRLGSPRSTPCRMRSRLKRRGMPRLRVIDLASNVAYEDGLTAMREAMASVDVDGPALVLLEQRPTITITKRGGTGAFISPRAVIEADGIAVVDADRGGDVTFHGPGQLTGYPVLRLGPVSLGVDVVGYLRAMEQAVIDVCHSFGVTSARSEQGTDSAGHPLTGVWVDEPVVDDETLGCNFHVQSTRPAKVCAIGVGLGGGVTRHGFALNVTTSLEQFTRHIVPCGINARGVTSLERLLVRTPTMPSVKAAIVAAVEQRLLPWHRPLS